MREYIIYIFKMAFADAISSVTKFKRVLKNHGYKFEGKRVMKIEEDGSENRAVIETTKKKAKTKVTGTSTPKKRRIEDDSVTGDGSDEDAGEGGQVKGEDGGAEYK